MKSVIVFIGVVFLLASVSCFVLAHGRKPGSSSVIPRFSAWSAYWDGTRGRQALLLYASRLEEADLFAYHFSAEDALVPAHADMKELRAVFLQLQEPKPRLAMTLVNDVESSGGIRLKEASVIHRVLSTPAARNAHIQQIMVIAEDVESIDIDYERVATEDGPAFTAFVQDLAAALHQKGKRLSVVVEPRISDERTSDPLSNGSNALSWRDIGQAADQLTVMAYLYHYGGSGPGSIAPVEWVSQIATYGLTKVPAEKLSIALHLGGYDWPTSGSGKSLEYDKAAALAAAYGKSIEFDQATQSGHFSYSDGSSAHEVWIETAAGLRAKIKALSQVGIHHIAFWRLGAGDPAFWDSLRKN